VFVPTRVPPHKEAVDDPGPEVRLALCEAAVGRDERFGVSRIELDRPGPSYTVDTLRSIHATSPGDELTFIVGGDMAASLPEWREPEALLDLAVLGVAERADSSTHTGAPTSMPASTARWACSTAFSQPARTGGLGLARHSGSMSACSSASDTRRCASW